MPRSPRARVYSSMRSPWPTAAEACFADTVDGRSGYPSSVYPAAMAAEVTRMTRCPASCRSAAWPARARSFSGASFPDFSVSELVPSLMTTVFLPPKDVPPFPYEYG